MRDRDVRNAIQAALVATDAFDARARRRRRLDLGPARGLRHRRIGAGRGGDRATCRAGRRTSGTRRRPAAW